MHLGSWLKKLVPRGLKRREKLGTEGKYNIIFFCISKMTVSFLWKVSLQCQSLCPFTCPSLTSEILVWHLASTSFCKCSAEVAEPVVFCFLLRSLLAFRIHTWICIHEKAEAE